MALIPRVPAPVIPVIAMRLSVTVELAALMVMPGVPETRTEAMLPPPSTVTDLVIVKPPNPPGSRASISPPTAVFEMAPAKVLQGAVRLHGLASSPSPETQVRVACAWTKAVVAKAKTTKARALNVKLFLFIATLLKKLNGFGSLQMIC